MTKRDRNDVGAKWRRTGDEDVSLDEDRDPPLGTSDENDDVVIVVEPQAGEGCSLSTSGVPLRPIVVTGATQGLPKARQGGNGPHNMASHPFSSW
jgi:hypothetical protein